MCSSDLSNPQVLLDGTMLTFDLSVPANEPLGQRVLTLTTDAGTSTDVASSANSFEVVNGPVATLTPIIAPALGIEIASDNQTSSDLEVRSNNLGVSLGDVITGLTPDQGRIGTEVTLTINGSGLQSVADIIITPDTGITTGTLTANAEGTQVAVDVTIAADAPETLRRIDLVNADLVSLIPAVSSSANRFLVVGNQPAVTAITPNFIIRDAAPVLVTVIGDFLDGATAVSVQPPQGVSASAPVVAADGRSIVFTRTRRGADRLAKQLVAEGIGAVAMHGGRTQHQRDRALKSFSSGRAQALVATDVAARGIHVEAVASVIHFDPPADSKDYLHRSGRTARAGAAGSRAGGQGMARAGRRDGREVLLARPRLEHTRAAARPGRDQC